MARRKQRKRAPRPDDQSQGNTPSIPKPAPKKTLYDPDEETVEPPPLTIREEEVRFWVVRGKGNDEIARILNGKTNTVRKHVENIRKKSEVESRISLIAGFWMNEIDRRDRIITELRRRLGR